VHGLVDNKAMGATDGMFLFTV